MEKCRTCTKEYDPKEVKRVYGELAQGFCSAQCYTKHKMSNIDKAKDPFMIYLCAVCYDDEFDKSNEKHMFCKNCGSVDNTIVTTNMKIKQALTIAKAVEDRINEHNTGLQKLKKEWKEWYPKHPEAKIVPEHLRGYDIKSGFTHN